MQHNLHEGARGTSSPSSTGMGSRWERFETTSPGDPMRLNHRHLLPALATAAAALTGTAAFAEDAPPPPRPAFTITGGATLVSDYRFRGISQTDRQVAVQGT